MVLQNCVSLHRSWNQSLADPSLSAAWRDRLMGFMSSSTTSPTLGHILCSIVQAATMFGTTHWFRGRAWRKLALRQHFNLPKYVSMMHHALEWYLLNRVCTGPWTDSLQGVMMLMRLSMHRYPPLPNKKCPAGGYANWAAMRDSSCHTCQCGHRWLAIQQIGQQDWCEAKPASI